MLKRRHVPFLILAAIVAVQGAVLLQIRASTQTPPLTNTVLNGDFRVLGAGDQVYDAQGNPYQFDQTCPTGNGTVSRGYFTNMAQVVFMVVHCGNGLTLTGNIIASTVNDPADVVCQRASSYNPDAQHPPSDRSTWPLLNTTGLCGYWASGYAGGGDGFDHGYGAGMSFRACEDYTDKHHVGADLILNTRPKGPAGDLSGGVLERFRVTCTGYTAIRCADATPATRPEGYEVYFWYDCATHRYLAKDSSDTVRVLADWSTPPPSPTPAPSPTPSPAPTMTPKPTP